MNLENEQKVKPDGESSRSYWLEHIKSWELSKLKQPAYCKQAGIEYNTFVYWRGVFLRDSKLMQDKTKFIPIKLTNEPKQTDLPKAIQIKLNSGHQVYLPVTMNLNDLIQVILALGEQYAAGA